MSGHYPSMRQRQLLLAVCFMVLAICLFLFLQQVNASGQQEGDYVLVIEFEPTMEEVSTTIYRVPLYVSGTSVSGEYSVEGRQGHEVTELTFEGTLQGDTMRGDISYKLSGSTAGYESSWTYSFYEPDVEFSVAEGSYTRVLVETSVQVEESGESAHEPYTEQISFYASVYPTAADGGVKTEDGETEDQVDGQEGEGETTQQPGGVSDIGDIPGPESWPQAATGVLFPGFLGLLVALLTNLYGGGTPPVETLTAAPPAPTEPPPPAAPPLDDLSLYARTWITNQKTKYSQYRMDPEYRKLIDRMERDCFGPDGRVDWEKYCDYEFGPVEEMKKAYNVKEDTLLLHAKEFAKATRDSAVETAAAFIEGAVVFTKGIIAIPGAIYQGYRELGGLFVEGMRDAARDFWNPNPLDRRPGLLDDLMNPDVIMQTGENLYETVGKELLPIEEIKCFFEDDATLEEKLWAVPSTAAKIANLIMLSPKIATMSVPGIPKDLTLIRSLRSAGRVNQAVEAAQASVPAEIQAEYDAYQANAVERASGITETVEEGGTLVKEQVLDSMSDPATMRVLKEAPGKTQSKFFATQARQVYSPVYKDVIEFIEAKYPGAEFRMKSVRTPGQKNLINTDNDVILQRKVTTPEGKTYWEEVPTKEWQGRYNESFSKNTGFSPEGAKARFPEENWDAMTPQQQQKVWAEKFGQETMDVKQAEAAHAFSDQPTAMRPDWKPGAKSPISEGEMVDAEGLREMYRYKTTKGFKEGNMSTQRELMEQGSKGGKLSKRLATQSQVRTGYRYTYPKIFEEGLEIVNMRELAPAVRDLALKNLGFRGGYTEFMDKLTSWMGGLG